MPRSSRIWARSEIRTEELRTQLANVRTFLAWVRVALALMVFGVVVAKMSLIIRSLGYRHVRTLPTGQASLFGVALVFGAAIVLVLALVSLLQPDCNIENSPSFRQWPTTALAVVMCGVGLVVVTYFIRSSW